MNFNIYQYVNNFKKIENTGSELLFGDIRTVNNPFISIIVPVYKREDTLYEALESAINQKNIDFEYEIIVLNDNPDGTYKNLDNYKKYKNIFFYRNKKNLGLYNNLNLGVTLSHGKYISFLHDDDLLYPDYLSEIYNFITLKKPNAKCIIPNRDVKGLVKSKKSAQRVFHNIIKSLLIFFLLIQYIFRKSYKKITLQDGLTYLLINIYKAPSCGVLFEKSCFLQTGGFNQDFWPVTDYFFFLFFNNNFDIYALRKKLSCYRWIDNLSQQKSVQLLNIDILGNFFKSEQPIKKINQYYSFFYYEILHAKYLMVSEKYRKEVIDLHPELLKKNGVKWLIFKFYNVFYKYIHGII
jgi:glycosyltransferase involved in cell wall biosynthesis